MCPKLSKGPEIPVPKQSTTYSIIKCNFIYKRKSLNFEQTTYMIQKNTTKDFPEYYSVRKYCEVCKGTLYLEAHKHM